MAYSATEGESRSARCLSTAQGPRARLHKLGATYAVNGWVGAHWSDTNVNGSVYTIAGKNIGKSTGTVFAQKTF